MLLDHWEKGLVAVHNPENVSPTEAAYRAQKALFEALSVEAQRATMEMVREIQQNGVQPAVALLMALTANNEKNGSC